MYPKVLTLGLRTECSRQKDIAFFIFASQNKIEKSWFSTVDMYASNVRANIEYFTIYSINRNVLYVQLKIPEENKALLDICLLV